MGFAAPAAGPNDLVVAVRADDDDAVARAVAAMELALAAALAPAAGDRRTGDEPAPRTVGVGGRAAPAAPPRPGLGARAARVRRGDGRPRRRPLA